jgi:hypothetical protein
MTNPVINGLFRDFPSAGDRRSVSFRQSRFAPPFSGKQNRSFALVSILNQGVASSSRTTAEQQPGRWPFCSQMMSVVSYNRDRQLPYQVARRVVKPRISILRKMYGTVRSTCEAMHYYVKEHGETDGQQVQPVRFKCNPGNVFPRRGLRPLGAFPTGLKPRLDPHGALVNSFGGCGWPGGRWRSSITTLGFGVG